MVGDDDGEGARTWQIFIKIFVLTLATFPDKIVGLWSIDQERLISFEALKLPGNSYLALWSRVSKTDISTCATRLLATEYAVPLQLLTSSFPVPRSPFLPAARARVSLFAIHRFQVRTPFNDFFLRLV